MKLSPAVPDVAELARAAEAAGADGLTLVNTIRGLALDDGLRPRLARAVGGYSGPALKPIALAAVYACRRATALPIVGVGGVMTGRDALESLPREQTRSRSGPCSSATRQRRAASARSWPRGHRRWVSPTRPALRGSLTRTCPTGWGRRTSQK